MLVLGIDPGATSGWAVYDSDDKRALRSGQFDGAEFSGVDVSGVEVCVIERPVGYGPTRPELVECGFVAGQLYERLSHDLDMVLMTRLEVKQALTAATRGEVHVKNDTTAWAALKLLHGDGCDKKGGALYGVKAHARAALAVAVAFAIRSETAGAALADRARSGTIGQDNTQ